MVFLKHSPDDALGDLPRQSNRNLLTEFDATNEKRELIKSEGIKNDRRHFAQTQASSSLQCGMVHSSSCTTFATCHDEVSFDIPNDLMKRDGEVSKLTKSIRSEDTFSVQGFSSNSGLASVLPHVKTVYVKDYGLKRYERRTPFYLPARLDFGCSYETGK